ncbi:S1 RNA-binding domain-containing protein [Bacillales bacterium AN1005]
MAELLQASWANDQQLEELARIRRNREIIKGVVISVGNKTSKVLEDGSYVDKSMEVAVFQLEDNITAYCPSNEFSDHEYKSLNGFTGSIQEFIITNLNLEKKIAIVSVREADNVKRAAFMEQLTELEETDELKNTLFKGIVRGFNPNTRRIFVRVNGADCYMLPNDWSWDRSRSVETLFDRGEEIEVKVLRFDKENSLIQVSRRATIEDPFNKLETLKEMNTIAGKVTAVSPIHGIFVQLDVGLEVKGIKPNYLDEPVPGDIVSCVVRSVDKKNRKARVTITGYPRGKKKLKDPANFLFE